MSLCNSTYPGESNMVAIFLIVSGRGCYIYEKRIV